MAEVIVAEVSWGNAGSRRGVDSGGSAGVGRSRCLVCRRGSRSSTGSESGVGSEGRMSLRRGSMLGGLNVNLTTTSWPPLTAPLRLSHSKYES